VADVAMCLQQDGDDYKQLYLDSQQELLQLKEEFERYKVTRYIAAPAPWCNCKQMCSKAYTIF